MKICIVGGGASGMLASIFLAEKGHEVILIEKNEKLGKKLYITGKGRCNLINDCEVIDFFDNIVHGEKFLRSSIYSFTPQDTMEFFENIGLNLVVERGNRVFPSSQKSSDVIKVMTEKINSLGVNVKLNTNVKDIRKNIDKFNVLTSWENIECDKVIVATGGKSYQSTGSTGDGYLFAKKFGHKVVEPIQALAPILVAENVSALQGISLKNVTLTAISENGKIIGQEFGEMLFTNRGLSGPIALSLSSYINRQNHVKLILDLKPALNENKLNNRILRDFEERKNQDIKNVTRALLPERLNTYVLNFANISLNKKVNSITKPEREKLIYALKNLTFNVTGLAPFEQAIITSGGVNLKNIKPCMESKIVDGLYFVGEVLDIDALTGGFNLQIAFSSAKRAVDDICKCEL